MKPAQIEAMLDYLETVMGPLTKLADRIEPQRTKGLCIGTSRTAILALRDVGVRADALAVQVGAYSPAYQLMIDEAQERGRQPTVDEIRDWQRRGAWGIAIGPQSLMPLRHVNGEGFCGHVIVAVERRWVIDLTLGQASRPEKGIPLPATAWTLCPPLARGRESAAFQLDGGVVLTYEQLDDRSYTRAHDWTHQRPSNPGVRGLARRLRQVAAGQKPDPLHKVPTGVELEGWEATG